MKYLLGLLGLDINKIKWQHHLDSYAELSLLDLSTALHSAAKNAYPDRVDLLLKLWA